MVGTLLVLWRLEAWSSIRLRFASEFITIIGYCAPLAVSVVRMDGYTGALSGNWTGCGNEEE